MWRFWTSGSAVPVELHCHTLFSVDGHGTPEELVEAAFAQGVHTLSITEHNNLGSCQRAETHAEKLGIRYLPGIEFDVLWKDRQLHFVGLGVNPDDPDLARLIRRHLSVYSRFHDQVLREMASRGFSVSEETLQRDRMLRYPTHPEPTPNVWHLRDFYRKRAGYADLGAVEEAFLAASREAKKQPVSDEAFIGGFEEIRRVVHQSGGVLLLAHVAKYFPGDARGQTDLIAELLEAGADGFELYHPRNRAEAHFEQLEKFAESQKCLISGGSDSHAAPGDIGRCGAPDTIGVKLLEVLSDRAGRRACPGVE